MKNHKGREFMTHTSTGRETLDQRGATAVTVVLFTAVMVMFAAFAIDIGHALVTKNELQNAADSAALAAGRQLGLTYLAMDLADQKDTRKCQYNVFQLKLD
jgi:Flp pilus assembly protein TadG